MTKKELEPAAATLTILIAYDKDEDVPDNDVIERIMDACKEHGRIEEATFTIHRAISRSVK